MNLPARIHEVLPLLLYTVVSFAQYRRIMEALTVIVPVHNALSQTARCLDSVTRRSPAGCRLLIVNDASDSNTSEYLRTFAARNPNAQILENQNQLGFLGSVNRGMSTVKDLPGITILLNSDTVVTDGWCETIDRCFASDPKIALATPFSNNADNLSIELPPGYDVHSFARLIASREVASYPDINTAVGFCLAIRNSVLQSLGLFDPSFGPGYGEESDYHFKVLSAGLRSVLVSNCFVYHESHASFSDEKAKLVERNSGLFKERWGAMHENDGLLQNARRDLDVIREETAKTAPALRYDVLFLLPTVTLCGGVIVVFELVNRLLERGIKAGVIVTGEPEEIHMENLFQPLFIPHAKWRSILPEANAYVATRYDTCNYAYALHAAYPAAQLVYLVQGYESWFQYAALSDVASTYRAIPNRVVVSEWLSEMLARWECDSTKIPDGVDSKFFTPLPATPADGRKRQSRSQLALVTMVRNDPQGGWKLAARVIKNLKQLRPDIVIRAVGDLVEHPDIAPYVDEAHRFADRKRMRDLYQRSDIFLDGSMVQGFGLMGLEAMSCGINAVISETGGVREYANTENAALYSVGNAEAALQAILRLADDPALRLRLAKNARETAVKFDWEAIADRYAEYFRGLLESKPAFDEAAIAKSLVSFFIRAKEKEIAENIAKYYFHLEIDRGTRLRSAEDIFGDAGRIDDWKVLNSSYEGVELIKLYELARQAVDRAGSADREVRLGLAGKVARIVG